MSSTSTQLSFRPRPRTRTIELVDALSDRIRDGRLAAGRKLPTEVEITDEFGVSRTVVREAISKLQASGLVSTRHGVGTFVVGPSESAAFRVAPEQMATLRDVIGVLELRMGLETEAAALAAARRTDANLEQMRRALDDFAAAVEAGRTAVAPDFQFHLEIARSTGNTHFPELMLTLGSMIIPRARLSGGPAPEDASASIDETQRGYLRQVNNEHGAIYEAIARQDTDGARAAMRIHLGNSRERRRRDAANGASSTR